jgi:prepilin-type processing-associated H-X9-DG protein
VVAIIALLAALLLPTLTKAKAKAQGIQCLSNVKQLQLAWWLYADDHEDWLVPNTFWATNRTCWVRNLMNFDPANSDNTNIAKLLTSTLGPYLKTPAVYRCPGDRSTVRISGRDYARVRSVSMNSWMASLVDSGHGYWTFWRRTDIVNPAPSSAFVFIDQREDSISDSYFEVHMEGSAAGAELKDFPASYHNDSGSVSFADGHAETRRWLDPRTRPPLRRGAQLPKGALTPNNADVAWLQAHATSRK